VVDAERLGEFGKETTDDERKNECEKHSILLEQ
jgi:hypothetical protein